MSEILLLYFYLGFAFISAPFMSKNFFLSKSQLYSKAHAWALFGLLFGYFLGIPGFAVVWPLFSLLGFLLYVMQERWLILSATGFAICIPFVFSLISALWFFSGVYDLHLLGYDKRWSFYAAIHGSVLGWSYVGCLTYLSKNSEPNRARVYLVSSYLSLILFLCIAFGIDGIPYLKRLGLIGFSIIVPFSIALFLFDPKKRNPSSFLFASISFCSILVSMSFAIMNEFSFGMPKLFLGLPAMTLTHGFLNAFITVPCFYLAIRLSNNQLSNPGRKGLKIVFFDGHCVLCNGTVSKLLEVDKLRRLRYASLQGTYARVFFAQRMKDYADSVVFLSGDSLFTKAQAVIQILNSLGGKYKLLSMFLDIFPTSILNRLYDIVATNRYRVLGRQDACLVPTNETKDLFIS